MVRPLVPSADVRRRVDAMVGPTADWRPVTGGYSAAGIWVVARPDQSSVFVKAATTDPTAGFLRDEHRVYEAVEARCMPELVGWDDEGEFPVLVLEDLSASFWPPPWSRERIDAVLAAAAELAALRAPDFLPTWSDTEEEFRMWRTVGEDPRGVLAVGLFSAGWLESALPALVAADRALDLDGDAVVHSDIRSDNLCLIPAAKFVDWNWTRRGDPEFDVVSWLPSLFMEGGPAPWEICRDASPSLVAALAGYLAHYASLPPSPNVNPDVRRLQRNQAAVCLDWLAHLGVVASR